MFSRTTAFEQKGKISNQNLKTEEIFDYIEQKNYDKIKEIF